MCHVIAISIVGKILPRATGLLKRDRIGLPFGIPTEDEAHVGIVRPTFAHHIVSPIRAVGGILQLEAQFATAGGLFQWGRRISIVTRLNVDREWCRRRGACCRVVLIAIASGGSRLVYRRRCRGSAREN